PFRPSFWARWSSRARRRARERWEQTVAAQRALCHEECERIRRDHGSALDKWRSERAAWLEQKMEFLERQTARNAAIEAQKIRYMNKDPDAVAEYCDMVLSRSDYPPEITKDFHVDYDPERGTLVVDYVPPSEDTLPMIREVKYVPSREEFESKPLGKREADRFYNRVICSIALRTLHELFEADRADALKDCVFNGFVDFVDRRDGRKKKTCILTVRAEKSRFAAIDLANVDPCECVHSLGALCAPNLRDRIPVKPMLQLSRDDQRFVPELDLGERIEAGMNVAALGWEEFEHLVRMILEKEVAAGGGEVKITRASRDAGVDAVIFDPDPIRGGKIVVQAKRYTNTVGVSAVRDLYGTILNEGASKGILITTSRFGPDAYDFAKNKPIVLIDGNNLLYLLEKQGLKAKIDLDEAKRLGVGLQRFR
ncbi:MAG: restriction endonuclease, partial [Geminicoccaceae bacterium]|nr:restriction endonuclease [Geminicoccaceae bacterium]